MYLRYHAGRSFRHATTAMLEAALVVAIGAALVFGFAVATGGNPAGAGSALAGGTTSSWIELASADGTRAATTQPSLGEYVGFNAGYPRTVKNPRIEVLCYRGGTLVFGLAGGVDYDFLLGGGGSAWKDAGGAAGCVANLYYFGWKAGKQTYNRLATVSFSAGG